MSASEKPTEKPAEKISLAALAKEKQRKTESGCKGFLVKFLRETGVGEIIAAARQGHNETTVMIPDSDRFLASQSSGWMYDVVKEVLEEFIDDSPTVVCWTWWAGEDYYAGWYCKVQW